MGVQAVGRPFSLTNRSAVTLPYEPALISARSVGNKRVKSTGRRLTRLPVYSPRSFSLHVTAVNAETHEPIDVIGRQPCPIAVERIGRNKECIYSLFQSPALALSVLKCSRTPTCDRQTDRHRRAMLMLTDFSVLYSGFCHKTSRLRACLTF